MGLYIDRLTGNPFLFDINISGSTSGSTTPSNFVFVDQKSDLPSPISGVITLQDNYTYFITSEIDLMGDRLVGGENTTIIGGSSRNCSITSTGLGIGTPLFTTQYTTTIRNITFKDVDTGLNIDGTIREVKFNSTGFNFLNIPNIGIIDSVNTINYRMGEFINSKGLKYTGNIKNIEYYDSSFEGDGLSGSIIEIDSGTTISRRFKIIYSSFEVFSGTSGITVSTGATISSESYILDTVEFYGNGTYIKGVQHDDDKASFKNCVGIVNSNTIGNMFIKNNTTGVTLIASANTKYIVTGKTEVGSILQRFTHDSNTNSLIYTSSIKRTFKIQYSFSLTSGNNDRIAFYIGIDRDGIPRNPNVDFIIESEVLLTASGNKPDSGFAQALVELNKNDSIYPIVENTSDDSDVTVNYLNLIVEKAVE